MDKGSVPFIPVVTDRFGGVNVYTLGKDGRMTPQQVSKVAVSIR